MATRWVKDLAMDIKTGRSRREQWQESYTRDLYPIWVYKHPTAWPRWLRRTMFLTLPISGPLWGASCIVITVLWWLSVIPIAIFNTAKGDLWD